MLLALGVVTLVAAGCGSPIPHPTSAEVRALGPGEPGVRVEDLERGRSLYLAKCGGCHLLHDPATIAADDWPEHVARMQREKRVRLAPDQQTDIVRYLRATSLTARRP